MEAQQPVAPRVQMKNRADEKLKQLEEEKIQAGKCFERMGDTEDGFAFLQYIYKLTGAGKSPLRVSGVTGDVADSISMVMAGRQEVWVDIRPLLSDKLFCRIVCEKGKLGGESSG